MYFVMKPRGYGKCYKEYKEVINYYEQEIARLNNAIDELEKTIKKKNKQINDMEKYYKDKIKEIRGRKNE